MYLSVVRSVMRFGHQINYNLPLKNNYWQSLLKHKLKWALRYPYYIQSLLVIYKSFMMIINFYHLIYDWQSPQTDT